MLCYNSSSLYLESKFVQKKKKGNIQFIFILSMEKIIMLNVIFEILSKYLSVEGFWRKISLPIVIKVEGGVKVLQK